MLRKLLKSLFSILPDKVYIQLKFFYHFKKFANLKNPKTFNEKIQWLKLHDRKDVYTTMVDKYDAKKYVADRIGSEYVIPAYGVWERFEDIDFDCLPDQFVLKTTHDCGGIVICRDKTSFDKKNAKVFLEKHLNFNYFKEGREWPYKNVKPRILAEKYMENEGLNGNSLVDYKFYCFNGKPKFLYVSSGLENHATASISFLNLDWTFAEYERSDYKPLTRIPPKPLNYEKMLEICETMSQGVKFLRVDLYEVNGKIYSSELTFHPGSGFTRFKNDAHDVEIGNMLGLYKG